MRTCRVDLSGDRASAIPASARGPESGCGAPGSGPKVLDGSADLPCDTRFRISPGADVNPGTSRNCGDLQEAECGPDGRTPARYTGSDNAQGGERAGLPAVRLRRSRGRYSRGRPRNQKRERSFEPRDPLTKGVHRSLQPVHPARERPLPRKDERRQGNPDAEDRDDFWTHCL